MDNNSQFLDDGDLLLYDGDPQFVDGSLNNLLGLVYLLLHDFDVDLDLVDDMFDVVDMSDVFDGDLNVMCLGNVNSLLDNLVDLDVNVFLNDMDMFSDNSLNLDDMLVNVSKDLLQVNLLLM